MKRIYQLGIQTIIEAQGIANLLRDKEKNNKIEREM